MTSNQAPITILLTGATGYLGRHLTLKLLTSGYRVAILKRPSSKIDFLPSSQSTLIGMYDIKVDGLVAPFVREKKVDIVIHLATSYGKHGESAIETLDANLNFPARLLETAIVHGTSCFINTDTYFNTLFTSLGRPSLNNYALSKGLFLAYARHQTETKSFRFINMRLEHLYGPGDSYDKFVNMAVRQLLMNPEQFPLTTAEQERDFIYINDVAEAYLKVVTHRDNFTMGLSEVGVGTGKALTMRQFMELLRELSGTRTKLAFGALPHRPNEIMASRADIGLLSSLGWQPRVSLEDGLRHLLDHECTLPQGI